MKRLSTTLIKSTDKTLNRWKNAASLIITAPKQNSKTNVAYQNFNLLMLKRHAEASFYPNSYVFPGGGIDEKDKTIKWIKIFESIDPNFISNFSKFFIKQDTLSRSPLFPGVYNGHELPNEIAFRICAIRESFEESGVLLLTKEPHSKVHLTQELLPKQDLIKWRKWVHNDAGKFMELCADLKMVPDIWCLHEWSNWLTPTFAGVHFKKRFDTVFYTCCLSEQPYTAHDEKETTTAIWDTPASVLHSFHNLKIIKAGPPQVYELRRMVNFSDYEEFKKHVTSRASLGMRRWLPIYAETSDGKTLSVYPGDALYPSKELSKTDSCYDKLIVNETYNELTRKNLQSNHFHYPQKKATVKMSIKCNFSEFGHTIPLIHDIPVPKPKVKSNI